MRTGSGHPLQRPGARLGRRSSPRLWLWLWLAPGLTLAASLPAAAFPAQARETVPAPAPNPPAPPLEGRTPPFTPTQLTPTQAELGQAVPAQATPTQATPTQTASHTPGSVSGTVADAHGALVAGAHVTLLGADGDTLAEAISDPDGHFLFPHAAPGPVTVTVDLQGFDSVTATAVLGPGGNLALAPFILQLSTVNVTVNAVASTEDLGIEQVHAEEKQRVIGMFPNFFVSYNWAAPALTTRQKYSLAWKNSSDPGNLLLVGTLAGIQQADNAFPGYHQGAKGYGKRYGADLADLVVGTYMGGAVLPSLFHQDPRYFYKGTGTVRSRLLYALSTSIICRGDNGHRQPAFASILGDLSAGAISNIYYPASDRQGAKLTFENGLLAIAGDAMNNLFQEFFLRKLTPKVRDATDTSRQ